MPFRYLNLRLLLVISVALLGAILLFLQFGQNYSSPFHRSTNGPLSSDGDSLQDVFNQTLGVSQPDIHCASAGLRRIGTV